MYDKKRESFVICPKRLLEARRDASSAIKHSHVCFYMDLWCYANWETGIMRAYKRDWLCRQLGIGKSHFNELLSILESEGYVKRLYTDGNKRSSSVSLLFVWHNKGVEDEDASVSREVG